MVNEHRGPAGPRPANSSPTKRWDAPTNEPSSNNSTTRDIVAEAPMLSTASNSQSLFSFGGAEGRTQDVGDSSGAYDFLPSVSFDDLQSSLESASTDFKLAQFPSPTGQGSILDSSDGIGNDTTGDLSTFPQNGGMVSANTGGSSMAPAPPRNTMASRGANPTTTGNISTSTISTSPTLHTATRPGRSGSILRRPSTASRKASISSVGSAAAGTQDAPTAPAAMRNNRRQSHYPPVSNNIATNIGKPPRKSIGPGVIDSEVPSRIGGQRRRPSLVSNGATSGFGNSRTSMDVAAGTSTLDNPRSITNARLAKTRSVGAPLTQSQSSGSLLASHTMPTDNRMSLAVTPRSPRGAGRGNGGAPGSASSTASQKRASMMPGSTAHQSHVSGLGARTISPTDTRRMKRMSMHQHPQSLNHVANAPPPPVVPSREDSRSPSMIPRKASATPSSSRTTPDINRKSYSSGLSVGSTTSYNTVRTSTGSIQPRLPQSISTTRLPAPKTSAPSSHNNGGAPAEDEEDVPPVPAIPKAYESPKDTSSDGMFLDKRKANLASADASSIHSNSTGSPSFSSAQEAPPVTTRVTRKPSARKSTTAAALHPEKKSNVGNMRKASGGNGMQLPPITVGPLNPSTAAKVAALQQQGQRDRNLSPPPSRIIAKTPTTPLTASKSMFFARNRQDDTTTELPDFRSSSTVNPSQLDGGTGADATDSSESIGGTSKKASRVPSMSPFLSSSLPKNGPEPGFVRRPKTGDDVGNVTEPFLDTKPLQKPSGPRAPRASMAAKSKSPTAVPSDPEEPPTPSSMSSLRRKLSLSWKRGSSKDAGKDAAQMNGTGEKPAADPVKSDNMPPPRVPKSATLSNLESASGPIATTKTSGAYLESRRRKSSASSLSTFSHDRTKSENWTQQTGTAKRAGTDATTERPATSRNPSVMQKILRPKGSSSAMRTHSSWSNELDKDDLVAEEEMKKMGSRRKETEIAAKTLDALKKRATPKERVGAQEAIRIAMLNIYERGEIVDYSDVYFCGTQNAKKVVGDLQSDAPNFGYDDERGDYTIVPGDHLSYRYEIIDILGKGSFGQVVRCIDHKTGVLVAVKIIRNKKRFHQQALVEVNILQKLREWDPKNKHSMVNFTHSFYFRGHLCISTELLDMNLYEFIKVNSFRGFSLKLIRRFTKQMLSSLTMLKQHKVIHCDLKPENILLRHPLHTEIKTIDFGSSCFENEKVYTYIQSRFYRSPEVILGMTYGMPIDMWSLGCILAELYTGVPIFPGENEQEQLACIMEVFGPPEKHLIEKSTRKKLFFDSMGKPRLTVSSKGRRRRPSSKTLQQALKCDDEPFNDFIARCLRWDPERRLKPEDAVYHEFITGRKVSVPVPRIPTRDSSPVKRQNTGSGPRPLPEPPNVGVRTATNARARENAGVSPHKPVSSATRRVSGATGAVHVAATKRTSTGTAGTNPGTSSLPRAAGRSVSTKQDLASAGAAAAMSRRV